MTKELIVTIALAAGGWIWAICQFIANRRWHKKDKLSDRRYEAYNKFMNSLDELTSSLRTNPNLIFGDFMEYLKAIICEPQENINDATTRYLQSIIDMLTESTKSLLIINQEINSLTLIASDKLRTKLLMLRDLLTDYNNEMQNCLSLISAKDANSFKTLETIGYNKRWLEFKELHEDIVQIMRKEINVK